MKKLTFILIGAGNRGKCYTQHAYMHGGYELVGIADPNEQTREFMREHYHIPKENCYKTYDELLARGKIADFAMICTQDRLHFAPAMKAIEQGYPLMLEKPVAPTPEECIQSRDAAEQKGVPVVVCHVLRYTPFARAVKQVIAEGRLGRIINIIHTECVGNIHYSHSFVRGPWRNTEESSNMLLAKSCHDLDLLQWLLQSQCKKVQSFGRLSYFRKENCPNDAPERCTLGCPYAERCPYNTLKIYRDYPTEEGYLFPPRHPDGTRFTPGETEQWLMTSGYGRCVFQCDNDVVDHQTVNLEYENGETVVFTMSPFNQGGRRIHIMGTKAELTSTDFDTIELFTYCDEDPSSERYGHNRRDIIKTSEFEIDQSIAGGHGGGDIGIMDDLWKLLCEGKKTSSVSDIRTSVGNHLTVFAAEYSRTHGGVLTTVDAYIHSIQT